MNGLLEVGEVIDFAIKIFKELKKCPPENSLNKVSENAQKWLKNKTSAYDTQLFEEIFSKKDILFEYYVWRGTFDNFFGIIVNNKDPSAENLDVKVFIKAFEMKVKLMQIVGKDPSISDASLVRDIVTELETIFQRVVTALRNNITSGSEEILIAVMLIFLAIIALYIAVYFRARDKQTSYCLSLIIPAKNALFINSISNAPLSTVTLSVKQVNELRKFSTWVWFGSKYEYQESKIQNVFNHQDSHKDEIDDFDVCCVLIELPKEDSRFKKEAGYLKRSKAFDDLSQSEVKIRVSNPFPIEQTESLPLWRI